MKNRIERIDYYKRSAFSISLIDHVRIERTKHGASIYLNGSPIRDITVSEYSSMEKTITDLFSKAYQEKYCAFDYEVQKENFELKFYLRLSYSDCIYHGLKGIRPFDQPYYQDIVRYFSPLIQKA